MAAKTVRKSIPQKSIIHKDCRLLLGAHIMSPWACVAIMITGLELRREGPNLLMAVPCAWGRRRHQAKLHGCKKDVSSHSSHLITTRFPLTI